MSANAKKKIAEFDVKDASVHDVATVLLDYLHHTSETTSEQHLTVLLFLTRWRADIEEHASPIHIAKSARIGRSLKSILKEALGEAEALCDTAAVSRADVEVGRNDKS